MTKRDAILDAATSILALQGPQKLSLDAVAERAALSKGGLLHHFGSKNALYEALVERYLAAINTRIAAHLAAAPPGTPWLYGYIRAQYDDLSDQAHHGAAALLVLAEQPALLDKVRAQYVAWRAQAQRDASHHADVVLLALEGLWLTQTFGTMPLDAPARAALQDALLTLITTSTSNEQEGYHRW